MTSQHPTDAPVSQGDLVSIAPPVCERLLGEPSSRSSREWRWGRKGSFRLKLDTGTWRDFEAEEGGGVLDGSDFPKQGRKSVGVARQYCGRLGKVANCQAGMFLAYVSPLGRALVDKGLYLPESWTSDKDRCEAAGVPEDRQGYRSKTELALEMVGRAQERGHLKAGWVAADDAFGMSPSFREGLAALGMWYVLDVPSGFTVWPPEPAWTSAEYQGFGRPRKPRLRDGQRRTMEQRSDELPEEAWPVAEGSQGPRSYLFATDQQAQARRNPLGRLPPEPGRQRTPLLPVRSGGYPVGDPGISRWVRSLPRKARLKSPAVTR